MKPSASNLFAAAALITTALTSNSFSQTTLLTDDFTVTGTTNTGDINFNLAGRQGGTQGPQAWTGNGNAQAGNNFFGLADPNYLLVADANGRATLSGMNLASLVAANEKLVISFDVRADGGGYGWTSFTLGNLSGGTGVSQPDTAATEFAFIYQNNTGIQAWDNGTQIINQGSTSGGNNFTFTFTDAATETGSPFGVNARVTITNGTNTIGTYNLNGGLSANTFITFGMTQFINGGRGGIDNLSVTTLPTAAPNRWSGAVDANWDETTANFTGGSFATIKTNGATTALFGDVSGTLAPVTNSSLTIASAGVEIADVIFDNNSVPYSLASGGSIGITGDSNLIKSGPGLLTVGNANTYTGITTISGGQLSLSGGSNRLPIGTAIILSSPGVLRLDGNHQEVASLTSNGRVVNGNATLASFTINNNANTTFSGNFGGSGPDENNLELVKAGSGTLNLTAASSYTGGTTIHDGTISLNHEPFGNSNTPIGPMIFDNTVTINNGGILTSDGQRNNWLSNTNVSSGGGNAISVVVNQGGMLKGSDNRITGLGNVTLRGGTIEVSNGLNAFGWFAAYNLGGEITVTGSAPSTITTAAGAGASANLQMADGFNNTAGGGTRFLTVEDVTNSPASDLVISARLSNGTLVKEGAGTVEITSGETGTGFPISWEITDGSFLVAEPANFEFRVTDTTSNRVFGIGSAAFNGVIHINTSAVTSTTGMIWSLIDVTGLNASFGANFAVAGFDDSNNDGVWIRTDSLGDWSFSEITGELALDVGDDYLDWAGSFTPAVGLPEDDDDNDGLDNFQEYAFGLLPRSGASVNPIASGLDKSTGSFSYTRRIQSMTGLVYTVRGSTSLAAGEWVDLAKDTDYTESITTAGDIETVTITLTPPPTAPRFFIQVKAEQP